VNIVDGALSLKTKTIEHVGFVLWSEAFCVGISTALDESFMKHVYDSGHSRVPIFKGDDRTAVCGILRVKQLICVDSTKKRNLSSLELQQPWCVSPSTNLVDLLNIFQRKFSGHKGGHLALVCNNPTLAKEALDENLPIPKEAGLLGLITLEDVIEELLTEEIYDEDDSVNESEISDIISRTARSRNSYNSIV